MIKKMFKNKALYGEKGRLKDWYDERLEEIGTNWCPEFASSLLKYLNVENQKFFVFISPTSNKGIYEKVIFHQLALLTCVEMHISDKEVIGVENDEEIAGVFGASKFINDGICDAKELKEKCDVVYDIKGAVWHERGNDFKELIKNYHRILNKDGILIIDCGPKENIFYINLNNKFLYPIHKRFRIGKTRIKIERSTLQKLQGLSDICRKRVLVKYFHIIGYIQTEKIDFALCKRR